MEEYEMKALVVYCNELPSHTGHKNSKWIVKRDRDLVCLMNTVTTIDMYMYTNLCSYMYMQFHTP